MEAKETQADTDVDGQAEAAPAADVEAETASRRDWGHDQGGGDLVRRDAGGKGSTAEQVEATASATTEMVAKRPDSISKE